MLRPYLQTNHLDGIVLKHRIYKKRPPFHQAKSLQVPDNIAFLFLPPYSPELNPIERLWQDIKAKLFQHALTSIEEMQDKITQILRNYTKTAIAQITNFKYFTKVANGI